MCRTNTELCLQLPVFITAVLAVRRMAFLPAKGLDSQGLAWFSDLTLPAVSMSNWAVLFPLGNVGILLPLAVTGLTLANIDQAFSQRKEGISALPHPKTPHHKSPAALHPFLSFFLRFFGTKIARKVHGT